ncbi:molybdate ABC transporter substrate-binding protein [Neisseria shayeganii]|uniref:Molybdate ABC transporter substrate-binding protein n=1 Tax=Neisseria shayeganii TaxID=607712 RepID=A0A7D7NAY2_9NEIS|nr:molybdate ABC transporter substrate-binding protein [Neisseria shayeganii]QMT41537.1 molybdate ABC transporter substrate-binding protein [Neisseria shayeganii]
MKRLPRITALAALLLVTLSLQAKDLTVSAASSLKDAFQEIAAQYERLHPEVDVKLNTAGSGALLQQLLQGAPVDVVAFADQKTMDMAVEKNAVDGVSRRTFVRNDLVLIVPKNSHTSAPSLQDLNRPAVSRIALSNPESVPVGRYARAALEKAGLFAALRPKIITTQNVRHSLDYVARGEVDAGFVYRTDAALMPEKVRVTATVALDTPVSYPIAVSTDSRNKVEAQRFLNFVLSPQGRQVLNKYGFSRP